MPLTLPFVPADSDPWRKGQTQNEKIEGFHPFDGIYITTFPPIFQAL